MPNTTALSLTLAGIFGDGGGKEGRRDEMMVEISSENSAPEKSRSDELEEPDNIDDDDEEDFENINDNKKKKRKKSCHRHTPDQIRKMEALFKECPHPDELQRLELSKQLRLNRTQVKFWFQNRRTQIKAIQERHENSLLKSEIEKLSDENKALRGTEKMSSCPNCGFSSSSKNALIGTGEQQLRIENDRLKTEVAQLRSIIMKNPSLYSSSCPSGTDQQNRSSGICGIEKPCIMDAFDRAMDELKKMATSGEPLWMRSYEMGYEILNYDEYMKQFCPENSGEMLPKKSIEASRDSGTVLVDFSWLVQSFMDVNQWKELFPCLISKAASIDVVSNGEGANRNGAIQLMSVEIQMMTPIVATRELYFVRYSKQLGPGQWAIVDVSIDKLGDNIDASMPKYRKLPSGCIIEVDKSNSHCKVTWVEHLECQKSTVHSRHRSIINTGLAFGARHWISTLQRQCERRLFCIATNVPTKDSSGVVTHIMRKGLMKLAQRMSRSLYRAMGASSDNSWKKVISKYGDNIQFASWNNLTNPGEPIGMIVTAVSSVWLPVSHHALFNFLQDKIQRNKWDIMSYGGSLQCIASFATGKDQGNAVTVLAIKNNKDMWLLQESTSNAYESMVVYALVDIKGLESVMEGCDSSNTKVLSSGFSILPDGIESRPSVIISRTEEKGTEGRSLLTMAFRVLVSNSPLEKIPIKCVESVSTLLSCTLQKIKKSLECEE